MRTPLSTATTILLLAAGLARPAAAEDKPNLSVLLMESRGAPLKSDELAGPILGCGRGGHGIRHRTKRRPFHKQILHLARLSPAGLELLATASVLDGRSWTAPALVGTRLYLRDRTQIVALELGPVPASDRGQEASE